MEDQIDILEEAKIEFMKSVSSLNYMVNSVGMNDAITRTWVRDSIEAVNEKFASYIKELVNSKLK